MSVEPQPVPGSWQQWPCGPDCRYAQLMPASSGEWHWCNHPQFGGRPVHDGLECHHYEASPAVRTAPSHWWN